MRRTLLSLAALATLAALLVPAALAARVSVRVEGRTQSIFGALETRFEAGANALTALDAASLRGEFYYHVHQASFGPYVDQIGRFPAEGASGWVYKVNGVSPPVGADAFVLEEGDVVLWYYATFGASGGPPTLDLVASGNRCYRALLVDDAGASERARDVVFRLDGRRVVSAGGRICPAGHWHSLRATKAGAIRSQTLGPR